MKKIFFTFFLFSLFSLPLSLQADEESNPTVQCYLKYHLRTWSAFYKSGKGRGTITCDNNQIGWVKIETRGGGISFGESDREGIGTFSKVEDITELYGSYASAEAHAGANRSVGAQAMTNGDITLTLTGSGSGWDLGFAFGRFKIVPQK
ncbi:MAG: hypothetical protein Q7S00_01810 [bacterium]|nr:hypothetical protein [bacterium]